MINLYQILIHNYQDIVNSSPLNYGYTKENLLFITSWRIINSKQKKKAALIVEQLFFMSFVSLVI
ncbi:hypothetical protein GCM10008085_27680 [Winogradskyella epiphytica]|nr:hypothetical protein GCM10008085_27680 [Winogradskyella epiphytica]